MLDAIFSINTIWWILMIIYIPACIGLIGIVLLQQGKGGGFGGALGGGAGPGADTVFGPKAQSLPVKMTYAGATLFMTIAIVLSVLSGRLDKGVAPELVQADGDAPTLSTGGGALSERGIGTAIVNDSIQDEAVPATLELEKTISATDEAVEEEATDAAE